MYDVIIIGKGPAGISASLYTTRAKLKTLVIGKDDSVLGKAERIENYYGFSESISGEYLLKEGIKQTERLGTEVISNDVVSIEKEDHFIIGTPAAQYSAKAVLLATGQKQKNMNIKNLQMFEGKGVSYCSTCDGFFYKNLKVGVLGFKDFAVHEAIELEVFTKNITIYTNGMEPEMSEKYLEEAGKFKMNTRPIERIDGSQFVEKIYFKDGTFEEINGIFVAYETASSIDFARKLGVLAEENSIIVDKDQQTNLEGLFAAGDCTGGFKQISVAVGQGALAGRKIIEYVRSL